MKKDQKKSKEEGYIPFDPEELKNITQEGDPNDEAYELLWEATCVSSHVSDTSKASGHADDDDIYPTSAQETDKMEELVNQAVAALKEPNPEFNEKVSALRDIIGWSRKRHWKLNWRIIVGVIIFIFILNHCASSKKADVNDVAEKLEIVKNWNEDNITIPLEKFEGAGWRILEKYYADAKTWKSYKLSFIAHDYYTAQKDIEYFTEISKNHKEEYTCASLICTYSATGAWSLYIGNDEVATYTGTVNRLYYEFMKDAYDNGYEYADLFGVVGDPKTKYKNLAGIFEYKRKIGGDLIEFIGEFDLVNKPFWYKVLPTLLKIYRKLKK